MGWPHCARNAPARQQIAASSQELDAQAYTLQGVVGHLLAMVEGRRAEAGEPPAPRSRPRGLLTAGIGAGRVLRRKGDSQEQREESLTF